MRKVRLIESFTLVVVRGKRNCWEWGAHVVVECEFSVASRLFSTFLERSIFTKCRQVENLSCQAVPGIPSLNQAGSLAGELFSMPVCHGRTFRDGFGSGEVKHIIEYKCRFNRQKKANVEFKKIK